MKKIQIWIQNLLGYGYCRYDIGDKIINYKAELPKVWNTYIPISILMCMRKIEKLHGRKIVAVHMTNGARIAKLYNLPYKLRRSKYIGDKLDVFRQQSTTYELYEISLIKDYFSFNICNDVLIRGLGKVKDTLYFNLEFADND